MIHPVSSLRHPFLPGVALALIGILHARLEASMATHMVAELPLLFACGWLAARAVRGTDLRRRPALDAWTLPMLLAALLLSSVWMLPVTLDLAVLDPRMNALKFGAMVMAGLLCGVAWPRAGMVLQGFFMLNWAWMTITAGLLYQDAPQQLCSVYLNDQQAAAGFGLVMLAGCVLSLWVLCSVILPAMTATQD
jgi:hypothetical protein